MAEGIAIEAEELGVVVLIGVLVVPGLAWIVRAKTGGAALRRLLLVTGVVAGALAVEAVMDRNVNAVTGALKGE
jgi:hypothetical protein